MLTGRARRAVRVFYQLAGSTLFFERIFERAGASPDINRHVYVVRDALSRRVRSIVPAAAVTADL